MSQLDRVTNSDEDDKFLFIFKPKNLAFDCCCGCSLRTGVQIISLVFLAGCTSNFFTAIHNKTGLSFCIGIIFFTLQFIAGVATLTSTFTFNPDYANVGYTLYAAIVIYYIIDSLYVLMLILLGQFENAYDIASRIEMAIIYLILIIIVLSIQLYMIWIIFSFYIHIKQNKLNLVAGYVYFKHNDPTERLLNPSQQNV